MISLALRGCVLAGTPFIIKWDNTGVHLTDANLVFTDVTIDSSTSTEVTFTGGKFVGTYSPIVWQTENQSILFLGEDNTLYYPQPDLTSTPAKYPRINACRAYFELNDGTLAREFKLNFGDGESAGITTTNYTNLTNYPDAWYTLDGRQLQGKPTKPGLYINNGRKVVIK